MNSHIVSSLGGSIINQLAYKPVLQLSELPDAGSAAYLTSRLVCGSEVFSAGINTPSNVWKKLHPKTKFVITSAATYLIEIVALHACISLTARTAPLQACDLSDARTWPITVLSFKQLHVMFRVFCLRVQLVALVAAGTHS